MTNVLISSAGRRVALAGCFRDSLSSLGLSGKIVAADAAVQSAAGQLADTFFQVPRCTEPGFIEEMLEICSAAPVSLVVPTIDTELPVYAANRARFREIGTLIAISASETIAICQDKRKTNRWLTANGFPTVRQSTCEQVLAGTESWKLPLIAKPSQGSASKDVSRIDSFEMLSLLDNADDLVVEEFAAGDEYTVNVYVNREGRCLCAVPHRRLETRGGEVSKGLTVKHSGLMELATEVAERLPGAYGPLNIQCFLSESGDIRVIEINARFGGGYPVAHRAGATYSQWLLEETQGHSVRTPYDRWEDGLLMLRYDAAVFVTQHALAGNNARSMSCVRS